MSIFSQTRKFCGAAEGFEQGELPVLVDEGFEAVRGSGREFPGVAKPFQQHDARPAAGLAQRQRLLDARDGKAIGGRERLRYGEQAMAVGIRLDDREYPAVRCKLTDPREVVLECRRVHDGTQASAQNAPSP